MGSVNIMSETKGLGYSLNKDRLNCVSHHSAFESGAPASVKCREKVGYF